MELIHTNGEDIRFIKLCGELDQYLDNVVGREKQQLGKGIPASF